MISTWKWIRQQGILKWALLWGLLSYVIFYISIADAMSWVQHIASFATGSALSVVVWIICNYAYASATGDWTEEKH